MGEVVTMYPVTGRVSACCLRDDVEAVMEEVDGSACAIVGDLQGRKYYSFSLGLQLVHRLFHAPIGTFSGCFVLHRTVYSIRNLYGNPYKSCTETKK